MSRVIEWIYDKQWAITPAMLETIIKVASREVEQQAILARPGEPVRGTDETVIRNGVAVIPVTGPIFPRANLFTMISGGVSVELLAQDFTRMVEDPAVKGIVLAIDSPGGEVTGIAEFSEMVYRAREVKPVTAYIAGLGASAAYWIASAADEVVMDAIARAGSIGVIMAYRDTTKRQEKEGVRMIEIVSSVSPNKRIDPDTGEGRAQIQRIVDDIADVFVGAVARNRGVERDTVIDNFGGGGIMVGARAVTAGLADRLGSLETIIADMAAGTQTGRIFMTSQNNQTTNGATAQAEETPRLTVDRVKAEHPEVYEAIAEAGATQERERIRAIEGLAIPGTEDLIARHKFDPTITEAAMSTLILQELREHPEKLHAAALREDGREVADLAKGVATNTSDASAEKEEEQDVAAKIAAGADQWRRK